MVGVGLADRRVAALGDFAQSARVWSNLVAKGLLASPKEWVGVASPKEWVGVASPKEWVGVALQFQDGTSPFVFRETVRRKASTDDPAVIVIQFRLRFLGSNPSLHAAFRRE
jgi:hypothetical protein